MTPQTFQLPWPVSTNGLWRAYRGRNILSQPARAWAKAGAMELMVQKARPIKGPVSILIELCPPTKRAFDIDNRLKAPIDLLVRCGVLEADDNSIVREVIARVGSHVGARITVTPLDESLRPWLAAKREQVAA